MQLRCIVMGFLVFSASVYADNTTLVNRKVMSRNEQSALTPDAIVAALVEGNQRFVDGTQNERDQPALVRDAIGGQFPKAIILSCVDSRVPVEDIFDQPLGSVFVTRVAANIENTDILGSIEFATRVSGAKVILVMGHENCGAIRAAIDNVHLGNITALLENVKPAVEAMSNYPGEQSANNPEFVHLVAEQNVLITMHNIREKSPVVAKLEASGQVKIVGALYSLETGEVDFID